MLGKWVENIRISNRALTRALIRRQSSHAQFISSWREIFISRAFPVCVTGCLTIARVKATRQTLDSEQENVLRSFLHILCGRLSQLSLQWRIVISSRGFAARLFYLYLGKQAFFGILLLIKQGTSACWEALFLNSKCFAYMDALYKESLWKNVS